ncbi:APC family permease [Arthrobacter sp. CAU 1506]|uniref:APC family permease n=1 Tax=Arthrobacter sp. CAU 1506 TaxID=2560052 RepID=UPI0010AB6F70|nr:APC family permease [Arthrobacter sp. CAU 1506]TJY67197.1 APC family permease [Arthrobacter sp. CAU 1506]
MTERLTQGRTDPPKAQTRLRGSIGVWGLVFMVVAGAAPLAVIGGTVPVGMSLGNGAGLPMIFLVAMVILLCFAVGFMALTPHVRNAGAFYTYIGRGLGRHVGFGAAFVALLGYLALLIGLYGLLSGLAVSLFESWGISSHWLVWAVLACLGTGFMGHRNIDLSKKVLGAVLIVELLIVVVFDAAVFLRGGGPEGISTGFLDPVTVMSGAPGLALLYAFLSFLGFEATAVFRDEVKDPDRTVPRATYLALVVVGVFYAVSTWALISSFGDDAAVQAATENGEAMLPSAMHQYLGAVAEHGVQVLVVTSMFACVLVFQNIVGRYFFTIANRGALPAVLGRAHIKHGSPYVASAVVMVTVLVFLVGVAIIGLEPINGLYASFAGFGTVGFIILLLGTSLSVLVFFARRSREKKDRPSVVRVFIAPALALLGLCGIAYLVVQNLPDLVGGSTTLAGVLLVMFAAAFGAGVVLAFRRRDLTLD